jgi:hypothetical protein
MCALLWKAHAEDDILPSSASSHREQAHHRVNLIATRYQFVQCRGESWRPKSGAASTNVATNPARIADGGAPATKM